MFLIDKHVGKSSIISSDFVLGHQYIIYVCVVCCDRSEKYTYMLDSCRSCVLSNFTKCLAISTQINSCYSGYI